MGGGGEGSGGEQSGCEGLGCGKRAALLGVVVAEKAAVAEAEPGEKGAATGTGNSPLLVSEGLVLAP